jgi:excisionase family DNA binding protein
MQDSKEISIPANTPWLTVQEAAAYIRRSDSLLYSLIKRGELPAYERAGKLVSKADLDQWIQKGKVF